MNTYKAFYKDKVEIVQAQTSLAAQKIAADKFKAKKSYDVSVRIVEKDGESIIHTADF